MNRTETTRPIVVVDPGVEDYRHLVAEGLAPFRFFPDGESALQSRHAGDALLWMIQWQLPDMPGTELHALLRHQIGSRPALLVADRYDPAVEMAALMAGSLHFVCKPLRVDWLWNLHTGAQSRLALAG